MKLRLSIVAIIVSLYAIPYFAQTQKSSLLETELQCVGGKPHPAKVIRQLRQSGELAIKPYSVVDSISLFKTRKPLTVWGLPVQTVFGWDTDTAIFKHGPGTSPPTMIGVVIAKSPDEVKSYLDKMGVKNLKIDKPDYYIAEHPDPNSASILCEETDN